MDVEVEMVGLRVDLEGSILEAELADVVRSLRVLGSKSLNDDLILLLVGELLLVNASHVGLVHEGHVIFIFKIVIIFLRNDGVAVPVSGFGLSSAGGTSLLSGSHLALR